MPRLKEQSSDQPVRLTQRWRTKLADYVTALQVSADGRFCVAGNGSGELFLIDAGSGRILWRELAHSHGLLGVSIAPDSKRLASCGQDSAAKLWSIEGPLIASLPGDAAWVEHVAWSPTGTRLATAAGRRVYQWTAQGEPLAETIELPSTVADLGWHPDGSMIAAAGYGGVYLAAAGECGIRRHLRWKGSLLSVAWSRNGQIIASCSQDCSVHFWRLSTGKDSEMSGYPLKPKALAWDASSTLLATSGHAMITIWQFRGKGPEGSKPVQLSFHAAPCTKLAFHAQAPLLASGAQDSSVAIWDPARSREPLGVAYLEDEISGLAWHPQSRQIVAGDASGSLACWDATSP